MSGITLRHAFKLLLCVPRLKTCIISHQEFSFEDDNLWLLLPLSLPITHNALELLEFYLTDYHAVAQFLQDVNFPSLRVFEFYAPVYGDYSSVDNHFLSFFHRSSCPLRRFPFP